MSAGARRKAKIPGPAVFEIESSAAKALDLCVPARYDGPMGHDSIVVFVTAFTQAAYGPRISTLPLDSGTSLELLAPAYIHCQPTPSKRRPDYSVRARERGAQ